MPLLSTLLAVLALVVVGGVGEDIGYVGIHQPSEGSSDLTFGRETQSRRLSTIDVVDANGVPLGAIYPRQDGFAEGTEDDWDREPTPTETASTQQQGTLGSEYHVGHVATHDEVENVRDNQHAVLGHMDGLTQHRQEQHRVPLQNMDNVQYFGDMMVGEPPQRMKVGDKHVLPIVLQWLHLKLRGSYIGPHSENNNTVKLNHTSAVYVHRMVPRCMFSCRCRL